MSRSKKKNSSIGCLFWIALILLILVVFLFNRETIQTVLDETGFIEIVQKDREDKKPDVKTIPIEDTEKKDTKDEISKTPKVTDTEIDLKEENEKEDKIVEPETTDNIEDVVELNIPPEKEEEPQKTDDKIEKDQKIRKSRLYFIEVSDTGDINFKSVTRPVYYKDSPLTATINALLQGLTGNELNMGLISLIPEDCKLISISVKNKVAYINFSENFRFNAFGAEGARAQLKQIVYTATEFSTVDAVQFTIEGAIDDYLSSEGIYIGKPLRRSDF